MSNTLTSTDVEDSGYIINKGVLYSIWTPSTTSLDYPSIVLPPEYQEAVFDSIKAQFNKCAMCAVHHRKQEHVAMGDMLLPASQMQVVNLDLIGLFVASSRNNKYVFTVKDHCSGWAGAYPIVNKRSQTTEHVFPYRLIVSHLFIYLFIYKTLFIEGCLVGAKHQSSLGPSIS